MEKATQTTIAKEHMQLANFYLSKMDRLIKNE